MGITLSYAAMLAKAKKSGVSFDKTLTIGHQTLFLSRHQLNHLAQQHELTIDASDFSHGGFADKFFEDFLKTEDVRSLDYSDYEESDIIHDMNTPVAEDHHEQYDAVIDGGSLEHIFNFPVAIENCMKLVKKGGSLFIYTTCNNHSGHGFYQFSPEVFYRIFQPANGYRIEEVVLESHPYPGAELSSRTRCYSVVDPSDIKRRVGLVSKSPAMILVHAVKTESSARFANYPIQSDYASIYAKSADDTTASDLDAHGPMSLTVRRVFDRLPLGLKNFIVGRYQLMNYSFSNKRFYRKWRPY